MEKPSKKFDMHRINRLIMLEQIPGFKLVTKDRIMLGEYREYLMKYYNYEEKSKNEQPVAENTTEENPVEIKVETGKNRRSHKRKANRSEEEPVEVVEVEPVESLEPIPFIDENTHDDFTVESISLDNLESR